MNCILCQRGMHLSCQSLSCACNQASHQIDNALSVTSTNPDTTEPDQADEILDEEEDTGRAQRNARRTGKRTAVLKDQQSTGRKAAAKLYPLSRDSACEWQNKSNCGGGTAPIRGCLTGKQQARHHGPDKSVVNNEEGNVHRICHYCHYRWHAANNTDYDWNATTVSLHSPRDMTETERREAVIDEMRYRSTQGKRKVKD